MFTCGSKSVVTGTITVSSSISSIEFMVTPPTSLLVSNPVLVEQHLTLVLQVKNSTGFGVSGKFPKSVTIETKSSVATKIEVELMH
jgi:hypothetical protein